MRALALLEVILVGYLLYSIIKLIVIFTTDGVFSMIFVFAEMSFTLTLVTLLTIIVDVWRVRKRNNLIRKGKLQY